MGIVEKDRLVFAKGYGYRDYGKKLPYTPTTVQPIASNTKLLTAVAAGLLVDEGKLDWDRPVRNYVPSIKFYNDDLDRSITVRDMLSHRTGVTRHDLIWYKSDYTQKELFDRLKYLEPSEPPRSVFLYNNMMYSGTGYAVELLSGKPWESFVRDRILNPLGMTSTTFAIEDMVKLPEPGVPYTERRDNTELYRIPYYSDALGLAPAGAINSSIVDMSHWLIALMNGGVYNGKQVLPKSVIRQTLAPSIALPNTGLEVRGWGDPQQRVRDGTVDAVGLEADKVGRAKAGGGRVAGTRPSHPTKDYLGEFEHPAYGVLNVTQGDTSLMFDFHKIRMPLSHFHYDRFDTPDDEQDGKWSVNFLTNPQGEIDRAEMSLDENAIAFTRRVPAALITVATLRQYVATYETPNGGKLDVVLRPDNSLALMFPNGQFQALIPWQPGRFRIKEFPDVVFEFSTVNGRVTEMKQSDPAGEYKFPRKP